MIGPIWSIEWALAFRGRRLFALNVLIPVALVSLVGWSKAPAPHAAAVFAILFVLFGTFGSAIPILRDCENGILRRIALTSISPSAHLLQRVLAGAAVDGLQLLPALGLAIMVRGGGVDLLVLAIAVLFLSLLVAGLVGLWVAAFARSIAEGALFSALAALLLLHASGIFRTPLTGSWGARVEGFSPYAALHELLLTGVGVAPSGPTSMLAGNSGWSAALASAPGVVSLLFVAAVLLAATWRLAGPLQRRLASSP